MQCSEVHSNASELITWDHQIRMIYSPVLAFTVSSVEWRHSKKSHCSAQMTDGAMVSRKRLLIAFYTAYELNLDLYMLGNANICHMMLFKEVKESHSEAISQ